MKHLAFLLLLLGSTFLMTSCDDEDFPRPSCEILAAELQERIRNNSPAIQNTRIEYSNLIIADSGVPSFDGCIAQFSSTFFNLDQLISYRVLNDATLVLRFP